MPWRARGVRSVLLRRRASRPQLKRDSLGGTAAAHLGIKDRFGVFVRVTA